MTSAADFAAAIQAMAKAEDMFSSEAREWND
jgi:hypothetical protein